MCIHVCVLSNYQLCLPAALSQTPQRKRIPMDLKSVYSNAVTEEGQEQLLYWLERQGFEEVCVKHTASVHLVQRGTKAGYALSFAKTRDG
jgi:hypothetical protein